MSIIYADPLVLCISDIFAIPVLEATDFILAEELSKSEEDARVREQQEFHALQVV